MVNGITIIYSLSLKSSKGENPESNQFIYASWQLAHVMPFFETEIRTEILFV